MPPTLTQEIVLIGGGHAHAIALWHFGQNPIPGVRLTLITDTLHAPYSGMLPGHIAGFYTFDQAHIDLYRLCQFAQAQLYHDQAIGLDLKRNQVQCAHRPPVSFDLLSLDIGSTPNRLKVPGASTHAIPVKPVSGFLQHWRETIEGFARYPTQPLKLAIVGGGAGGVELALTMQQGLFVCRQATGGMRTLEASVDASFVLYTAAFPEIHLFHEGREIMPSHNAFVRQRLTQLMQRRDIHLHLGERVTQVTAEGVRCQSGLMVECNKVFWVTQASAPDWLKACGLATDSEGFVLVKDSLQSISHPQVFAAGDMATMVNYTRPKAGVFAVRQGKPLYESWKRAVLGKPSQGYRPQRDILGLIGTGDGQAIASWGKWGIGPHPLLWRWKDWIDRRFMARFSHFPAAAVAQDAIPIPVPAAVLTTVLHRIKTDHPKMESLIQGDRTNVAIESVSPGMLLHSVDTLTDFLRDPYVFGTIVTHHGLNALLARGATPQSSLAWIELPQAETALQAETLYQVLLGMLQGLGISQTQLVGCTAFLGSKLSVGLSSRGHAYPEEVLHLENLQPGQVLILTKALGVGTLLRSHAENQGKGRWLEGAIASMLQSNYPATVVFLQTGATACTAVGSLGLLGHLIPMVSQSSVAVTLNLDYLPVLDGAIEGFQQGNWSLFAEETPPSFPYLQNASSFSSHPAYPLLFEPQISGGLVAGIPKVQAIECLKLLQDLGYTQSAIIGEVHLPTGEISPIKLEVTDP